MYEIDQSGKIEDTARDTILALTGTNLKYTVKIPSKVKREMQEYFKMKKEPGLFIYKTFSTGIYFLISAFNAKLCTVTIDREYTGKEVLIERMIRKLLEVTFINGRINILFMQIGKTSPAHDLANDTASGKKKEDRRISFGELKKTVSYLSPGWLPVGR